MNPEMPAETVLWLASAAGAGIFLLLGILLGRGVRPRALASENARLEAECARIKAESEQRRLADAAARVTLEQQSEADRIKLARLQDQLADRSPEGEAEKTLRHDLALARELLRKQEDKAWRLEEGNGALRAEINAMVARAARNDQLEREVAELRSRALATDLSQPPAPSIPGPHALDQLAAQLLQVPPVRAAVIADDLGLVISAQGSHGDELAALGALFNRACNEARRILPLGAIQRIAIEDENHIHVSMRTVYAAVPSGDEDQLTLVTLAHGFEPDPSLVSRALAGASSPGADAVVT